MHDGEQPPEDSREVPSHEPLAAAAMSVSAAGTQDEQPEREIVLAPELVAAIARPHEPVPRYLRIARAFIGLLLLGVAWGAVILVLLLASVVLSDLDEPIHLTLRFVLIFFGMLLMLWL